MVPPGSTILVTGINGHIGSTLVIRLLEDGFRVHGTVRNADKGKFISKLLSADSSYGDRSAYADKFALYEIPDFSSSQAYSDAMKGVAGVLHIASPNYMVESKPEVQAGPAVAGTLAILEAAMAQPSVTRVTLIGTIGSVIMNSKTRTSEKTNESDWNVVSEEACKDPANPGIGFHCYLNSKIKAEKAAWGFVSTRKPSFTLNVVLPSIALGPVFQPVTAPPRPDVSLGNLWDYLGHRCTFAAPSVNVHWVHSYDVADVMIRSLTSPKATGRRIICTGGKISWGKVCEILKREFPERDITPVKADEYVPQFPGAEEIEFDLSLAEDIKGSPWRSLEDAVLSASKDLLACSDAGWDRP